MFGAVVLVATCVVGTVASADIAEPLGAADDGAPLMRRVAAAYTRDVAGVVAVRSHSDLRIAAPLFGRHIVDDDWYVYRDGTLAASSHKVDPRQPPLHDPYRERYLDEYTYRHVRCPTCAAGTAAIAYESDVHDVAHAHGTFVVDDATAHIVRGSETPYSLPWPTKSGELEAVWADSPTGWFPVKIVGAFVGRIGPFVGRAQYAQDITTIDRYASVATATAELMRVTGRAPASAIEAESDPAAPVRAAPPTSAP